MKNKTILNLDEDFIQAEARDFIGRKLTDREYKETCEKMNDDMNCLVRERIGDVVSFKEMLKQNKNVEKDFPHYKVLHRNKNEFQVEFDVEGVFRTEEDAQMFTEHGFFTEFDEWKIIKVNANIEEKEVYKINC